MAKRLLTLVVIASLAMLVVGCGDDDSGKGSSSSATETKDQKQWKVAKSALDANQQFADALKTIKDGETAKAAAPKVQAAIDNLKAVSKKMDTMEEPSEELKEKMKKEFFPVMEKAQTDIAKEMERIGEIPEAMTVLKPILESLEE